MDTAAPQSIRRKSLVLPGLVPVVVVGVMFLIDRLGAELNPHGGAGYLLLLMAAWAVVTAIVECVLIARSVALVSRIPALRTSENILAIGFAAGFVLLVVLYFAIGAIIS